jgi:4-hydroxy-3-polyprenylbenzoate decarboxylase
MVDHSIGRVLDLFGLESGKVKRWGEAAPVEVVPLASKKS